MNLTNFTFSQDNIAIEQNDRYFDLHNNFDFVAFKYDVQNRSLRFIWVKNQENWVSENSPSNIELLFTNVTLFKSRERDITIPYSEDDCLESMGFSFNELQEEMDNVISNVPKKVCSHFNLIFMSGFAVKIAAESVSLTVE